LAPHQAASAAVPCPSCADAVCRCTKFLRAAHWICALLHRCTFPPHRVRAVAAALCSDAVEETRDGWETAIAMHNAATEDDKEVA
jgi:hypothetical protein